MSLPARNNHKRSENRDFPGFSTRTCAERGAGTARDPVKPRESPRILENPEKSGLARRDASRTTRIGLLNHAMERACQPIPSRS